MGIIAFTNQTFGEYQKEHGSSLLQKAIAITYNYDLDTIFLLSLTNNSQSYIFRYT